MKILQVHKFYYLKGGAERYFFDVSELLEKNGHIIIPFAMQGKKNKPSEFEKYFVSEIDTSQVKFSWQGLRTAARFYYSFEARSKVEELIKKTKPELVHLHNIYHHLSPSILPIFKKYNLPVVMTVHDWKLICPNYLLFTKGEACERCKVYRYWNCVRYKCLKDSFLASAVAADAMCFNHWLWRPYKKYIDLFIAPSRFVKLKLIEWGYPKEKIEILPHSVKITGFMDPRFREGDKKEEDYILYFGRLSKEKGVDVLLEAMKELPEIKLKIAGTGPEYSKLQIADGKLKNACPEFTPTGISGLGRRVEFLGFKEGKELEDLIDGARFVVAPSVVYETGGLVVLESFARAKPVVAAMIGGIPELVENKKTGLLFKPGDSRDLAQKIKWLWDNPREAEEKGKRAYEVVRIKYSPERHYEGLMGIYRRAKS